jgi:hypothetical protein
MTQNILQQNISKLLGIEALSPEEQSAFLAEVGDVIFQTSLLRLVSGLSDEQQQALEDYVDIEPEPEVLLQHLLEHYKDFETILEAVVTEFKEDAQTELL